MRFVKINRKTMGPRGFSLLEVVIALAIFSIGILGYIAIQFQAVNGRAFVKTINNALTTSATSLDEIRLTNFNTIPLNVETTTYRFNQYTTSTEDPGYDDYKTGQAERITTKVSKWNTVGTAVNPDSALQRLNTMRVKTEWVVRGHGFGTTAFSFEKGNKTGDDS